MATLQEHIPREQDATEAQEWGFTLWEFIAGNWLYLLAILVVLGIFWFARYSWRKEKEEENVTK